MGTGGGCGDGSGDAGAEVAAEVGGLHLRVVEQVVRRRGLDDLAGLQDVRPVRRSAAPAARSARPAGPWCPAALISVMIAKICWISIGASPIDGSSSSSSRGPGHQRPADGEHLLLAAGHRAADLLLALRQPREQRRSTRSMSSPIAGACGPCARTRPCRGSPRTVMPGKMPRPSGAWQMPSCDPLVRGQLGDVLAVEADRARGAPAAARRWSSAWWSCRRRWRRSG